MSKTHRQTNFLKTIFRGSWVLVAYKNVKKWKYKMFTFLDKMFLNITSPNMNAIYCQFPLKLLVKHKTLHSYFQIVKKHGGRGVVYIFLFVFLY